MKNLEEPIYVWQPDNLSDPVAVRMCARRLDTNTTDERVLTPTYEQTTVYHSAVGFSPTGRALCKSAYAYHSPYSYDHRAYNVVVPQIIVWRAVPLRLTGRVPLFLPTWIASLFR